MSWVLPKVCNGLRKRFMGLHGSSKAFLRLSGDSRVNFEMHVGVWEFPKTGDPNVVP